MRNAIVWTGTAVLAAVSCGCGNDSDKPETGIVKGTVTLDGKAVGMARIYFSPVEGGQTSEAITDASGHYDLIYKRDEKGAKIGKHRIVITTFEEPTVEDDGSTSGGMPERIPARFNKDSTLEEEVVAGENEINFTLTSK